MLQFESFACDCNIFHFITTRHGGVSVGNYASLNLGDFCGDNPEAVRENRSRLCETLGIAPGDLYVAYQTHGSGIRVIGKEFLSADKEQQKAALHGVDALLTNVSGIALAVTTADCVPVLLYAPDKQIVGVVHAGWRGTVSRLTGEVVDRMVTAYGADPETILAGIGPSIGQEAFEVGEEVADAFKVSGFDLDRICRYDKESGKAHFDLVEANRQLMLEKGVRASRIEAARICTYTMSSDFYSARKSGIDSGRFLTGIMLNK